MRASGVVLAMTVLLAPSLSHSQSYPQDRRAANANVPAATLDPAKASPNKPVATAAAGRRSLMGVVMDVLIASAEQQSAQEAVATRQAGARNSASAQLKPAVAAPAAAATLSPDLVTREQIAVESEP